MIKITPDHHEMLWGGIAVAALIGAFFGLFVSVGYGTDYGLLVGIGVWLLMIAVPSVVCAIIVLLYILTAPQE